MGTADAVPGVSGGTVALLLGFYERLITAVSGFGPSTFLAALEDWNGEKIEHARDVIEDLDLVFLITLGLGMVTAVALVARGVTWLYGTYPVPLFGFFTGLIAASALVLYRGLRVQTSGEWAAAIAGFAFAFFVSGGGFELATGGYAGVFLAGMFAISAMVLPGISGSLILLLLGKYVYMSSELTAFTDGLVLVVTSGSVDDIVAPAMTVFVFVAGGFVGLVTIARVIRVVLTRHRSATLAFLVSLITGSVRAPLEEVNTHVGWSVDSTLVVLGWAVLGAIVLIGLDILAGGFDPE